MPEEVEESAVGSFQSDGQPRTSPCSCRRRSSAESIAWQPSGSGQSSRDVGSRRMSKEDHRALLAGLGLEDGNSPSGSDSEVAAPFHAGTLAAAPSAGGAVAAVEALATRVDVAHEARRDSRKSDYAATSEAAEIASLRRHATMLELEEETAQAPAETVEEVPKAAPEVRSRPSRSAVDPGRLRHATLMDLEEVAQNPDAGPGSAPCLTTPSASEASERHRQTPTKEHSVAAHARSITSSEMDFLPGAETVPKTPLAQPKGDLTLPPSRNTGQAVSMVSGHVRAHQRLSPRCSPRLAQSAFSAQEAAGLTPRGSKHEDSGLWIPAPRSYEGLSGLGSFSSHRLHKVEHGFRGYVDLCEGVGPGCAPNLGGAEDVMSPQVESPREKQVPATALSSNHVVTPIKFHRPPRPSRAQRATWPPVEAPRQSQSGLASGRLSARGAPRLRGVRPPSYGVGQDSPLPEVSPTDIVLEERAGAGSSIPAHSSALKTEEPSRALGGLAATRQKVLMLREQVGALAAYCDRLEHAAGLADGWRNGLLPLGPAHTAAMTQAAQQLSIWASEPSQSWTPDARESDASRREMASWLADLTKTSRSADSVTASRFGPDEGAGPVVQAERRTRKSRALARRLWWLIKTGQVEHSLTSLRWIHRTLQGHHSKDPHYLFVIRKRIDQMTHQQKNAGWLCHWCRVMNGKHALCCHRCGGKWYDVGEDAGADYTYWHQSSGKGAQRHSEAGQWPAPPQTKGRDGTKSPRPSQQGQPQGNAGNQRRRSRRGKKQTQATEQMPAPSATAPMLQPPQIPSTGGTMSWMTLCNMQQVANQAIAPPEATPSAAAMGTASSSNALPENVKKLLTGLKKDQDKLSPENQELVKTLVVKEERDEEQELQDAVKSLGQARRDLQAAFQARSNLHAKWRQFLSMSVAQWQAFTQEFQAQETDAVKKISDAKEAVAQAKTTFESSKETVVFKPENYKPTEVQDLMSDDEGNAEPCTTKLQEGLSNLTSTLQNLHRTAEAAHAEEQAAKKARLGDASDVSGLPGGDHCHYECLTSSGVGDPLSSVAVLISPGTTAKDAPQSRLSDEFHSIPARIVREGATHDNAAGHGHVPTPPPLWIDSIFDLPTLQALTPDAMDEQGILLRTWYLHHRHMRRWTTPRFVELTHDWTQWQDELFRSWRDLIQPGEAVRFHHVLPDPERHYVRRRNVIADVIISQGEGSFSGLITIYETAQQPSAVAVSLPAEVSGLHLSNALDLEGDGHFQNCAFHFGWIPIRRLPFPTHRVADGQSFVCRIYTHAQSSDAVTFMQKPLPKKQSLPRVHNEGDVPLWYPFPNTGGHRLDGDSPAATSDAEQSEITQHDDDPGAPDADDPNGHDVSDADQRQSALMYHLADNPIHTMLFWTDFEHLMQDIAWHYGIQRHDLYDCYELTVRPVDIPEGTAPLIVHFVNDFPHGANMALILLDVEIHGNVDDPNFFTAPEIRRRVLAVPTPLSRDTLLIYANTFEFCRIERHRCLIEFNKMIWPLQNNIPVVTAHGDYVKIILPPPQRCRASTRTMLLDSQEMEIEDFWSHYYVPTSSENEGDSDVNATSSNVSPSLIASEDIKREFGPQNGSDSLAVDNADDELSQLQFADDVFSFMQHDMTSSSSASGPPVDAAAANDAPSLAPQIAQIMNESCLFSGDPAQASIWPMWFRQMRTAFWHFALIENPAEGPVAYFDTWYADCRGESVSEVYRTLRLDHLSNLWIQDLRHLWRDRIQPGHELYLVWVVPTPPPRPLTRTAGHLILYQFPREPYIPFLLTFQFMTLDVEGFTHSVVTTDADASPFHVVTLANMDRVCRGRRCTLHRGAVDATWTEPIRTGESIRLAIPAPGERSHDEILTNPRGVAQVQTAPAAPLHAGPSMRLEDQSAFVQRLHGIWSQFARAGPAHLERLLEVTTWYLDGVYVTQNDGHRTTTIGDDFTSWEDELRAIWSDVQDASLEMTFVLVRPTPRGFPVEEVHILLLQQIASDTAGVLISTYDNSVHHGAPFATAVVVSQRLNRAGIIDAVGRSLDCSRPSVSCSTWQEGLEIQQDHYIQVDSGQSFALHVYHHRLTTWEAFDAQEDHVDLLQRSLTKVVSLHAVGDFKVPLPDQVEVPLCSDSAELELELRSWGQHCDVIPLQFRDRAFCIPSDWTFRHSHRLFLFEHEDLTDLQGFLAHPIAGDPTDLDLMKLLHQFGYEKAVIIQKSLKRPSCVHVLFSESTGTMTVCARKPRINPPWPVAQPCVAEAKVFDCEQDWTPPCFLDLGITLADLRAFFASSDGVLVPTLDGIVIPEVSASSVASLVELQTYDRLVIYVDGSSQPSQKHKPPLWIDLHGIPDAWAFLVLGERYQPDGTSFLCLVGWQSQQVRYQHASPHFAGAQHASSLVAEREGLIFAALWRLCLNSNIPTVFRSDSLLSCGQAQGWLGTDSIDVSFTLLRSLFQALETSMPVTHLLVEHVYGHNGDVWNELVDSIARAEAASSHFAPRQNVDLSVWSPVIPFLWLLFAEPLGGPKFCGSGFDVCAPALPNAPADVDRLPQDSAAWTDCQVKLSFATANVNTLGVGPDGFPGKLAFLKHQFLSLRLNFLGVQEARTSEGCVCSDSVLRLCSGSDQGKLGVELWCNLSQPCLWAPEEVTRLTRQHFQVLHRDPRRLLVRIASEFLQCLVFVGHALHNGHSWEDRQAWWADTTQLLQDAKNSEPVFVLLDANATPGSPDSQVVLHHGTESQSSTPLFRHFLEDHLLCLPSTTRWHHGPRATWTTPDGLFGHQIDFVAIPQDFLPFCTWTQTLTDLDLATAGFDHTAVGLEVQWPVRIRLSLSQQSLKLPAYARAKIAHQDWRASFLGHPCPSWETDVDSHVSQLNEFLHAQLASSCHQPRLARKKPFVTEAMWELRRSKLRHRRQLKRATSLLRREALARVFAAWRHADAPLLDLSFNFGCTLLSGGLKHAAGFVTFARRLKRQLCQAKQQVLAECFASIPAQASASEILHVLRPFVGSSNALKKGPRPLPFVLSADGAPCDQPSTALNRWIEFFMHMEGGFRSTKLQQHARWVANLAQLQVDQDQIPVREVPSLVELESAMRRIKPGKATGPDFLPAELFHFHAAGVAKQSYALFLKSALQAHEPLIHKGGWLIPLWKGKGDRSLCSSFRSILISAHMAKAFHRSLRVKHCSVYQAFMQKQQIGGRPATPVGLGVHQVRAFQRSQSLRHRPCACIFLDLAEAFYRVIRPLAVSGDASDEMLAFVAQRLNLNADAIAELHSLLEGPGAIAEAGLAAHACRAVRGLHLDTHFSLHGQEDRCVTTIGSRPGDAWADMIFGFLFAKVLKGLQQELSDVGLLDFVPIQSGPVFFAHQPECDGDMAFLGPCWCDDLCVCISGATMPELKHRTMTATSLLLDACLKYGMLPNLQRGKTEIMFTVKGKGSRSFREHHFGPSASPTLPIVGEHATSHVHLVGQYSHLGCVLHHSGDLRIEVRKRLAVAHQTFSKHRKLLLHNPVISLQKRAQIFQSLIGSRLLYGAESWVLLDQRTRDFVHASIMRLYRRLLRVAHDAHLQDDDILDRLQLPSPTELLRIARLRYLGSLFACQETASWGLLNLDRPWIQLVEDDLMWMHSQLHHSSDLQPPHDNLAQWMNLIIWHRPYWKRLVKRASRHAILQRSRQFRLLDFHRNVFALLNQCGQTAPPPPSALADSGPVFGCMLCQVRCKSKGGEGAHMNRKHGQVCPVRTLFQGTQCAICLKEFFTHGKLKGHLLRCRSCRTKWLGRADLVRPAPGIGSQVDRQQEIVHDRALPPLQAAGPQLQFDRERDFLAYDLELHDELALLLLELPLDQSPVVMIRQFLCGRPVSWTQCCATLDVLLADFLEVTEDFGAHSSAALIEAIQFLRDPGSWDFLVNETPSLSSTFQDLPTAENAMIDFEFIEQNFCQVPRQWNRDRVILHAFAGRRRKGDVQFFLDQFQACQPDGVTLHTASVDILYDLILGDVACRQTQDFWYHAIDAQQVVAFLGGPPCESWSKARAVQLADERRGPRIVRDADHLWGLLSLRIKELLQIILGNDLLTFTIMCLLRLARVGGVGIMEHPADPSEDEAASVWRLPVLHLLQQFPGVCLHHLSQGLLGAPTPKPTTLLGLNLPGLLSTLRAHCITAELPKRSSIGRLQDGSWATTRLKEYPPALCMALAAALNFEVRAEPVAEHGAPMNSFLSQCMPLFVQQYAEHLGPDYAGPWIPLAHCRFHATWETWEATCGLRTSPGLRLLPVILAGLCKRPHVESPVQYQPWVCGPSCVSV
eukprot:s982_g8.t1